MRIAFLCKRRYMGKDVISDRYARLYEIPYQLARLGHQVEAYCLDYRASPSLRREDEASPGHLHWSSSSLGLGILPAAASYPARLLSALRRFDPDVVIGASDIPHVAVGRWLSRKLSRPYVADLYDNFEGFGQARIPGMVPALRRAVRDADMVLTTSGPLREFVIDTYRARGHVIAVPSGVDAAVFHPRDKATCRAELGLPQNAPLVGTAGGLYREKGIGVLYDAWRQVSSLRADVHLVLAGPVDPRLPLPPGDRVHYLGMLSHPRVAELFCALDVGVMSVLDTSFGRYCFPQKAYEMLACNLPVVAADVGALGALLADVPQCLFRTNKPEDLVRRMLEQLEHPVRPSLDILDWQALIGSIEPHLRLLASARFNGTHG